MLSKILKTELMWQINNYTDIEYTVPIVGI